VIAVSVTADAHGFVVELLHAYDTLVQRLSVPGGQKQ
jgi:hypothetical protein